MVAAVTVSLAPVERLANAMVVPVSIILAIDEERSVFIYSNAILF
jgi:exosortase/archaeosortase